MAAALQNEEKARSLTVERVEGESGVTASGVAQWRRVPRAGRTHHELNTMYIMSNDISSGTENPTPDPGRFITKVKESSGHSLL
jgi:hypothetical protein